MIVAKFPNLSSEILKTPHRYFSTCKSMFASREYFVPFLMEMPNIASPNLFYTIRNHYLARTLIAPYVDKDFSISDFDKGAHLAASSVSHSLANGDISCVNEMVTPEALNIVRENLRLYTTRLLNMLQIIVQYFVSVYAPKKREDY